ncbi:MAG: TolB family protein [Phycisphaerales bacterium]
MRIPAMLTSLAGGALALSIVSCAAAQPGADAPLDWRAGEADMLRNHVQLTFPSDFEKAGEAYFNRDATWVVFQAIPAPAPGEEADADYSMYIAPLERDADGRITGLGEATLLSPPGSANTCGWFHPLYSHRVIYGSTLTAPAPGDKPGYQRGESRYAWAFPPEMEVVQQSVPRIWRAEHPDRPEPMWAEDALRPVPMWTMPGYDAECSISPDARFVVFTHVDAETNDPDLWIHDVETGEQWPIVEAPGYDGGPFFSPDGKRLVYRSDRVGNDLLQVYVADLEFDDVGRPVGVATEHEITANEHVNWAPYWHPSGEFLVYATSEVGHWNYEVYAIAVPPVGDAVATQSLAKRRITLASGFDGLPVFSNDGSLMMWTRQRAGAEPGEDRPSSQIWIAETIETNPR